MTIEPQDRRRALGAAGEACAASHLESQGYRVLARNVRAGGVEIDLIVERAGLVVFVEVKTRSGRGFGLAHEAVDARKRARLVRGAAAWLDSQSRPARRVRFDVISCERAAGGGFHLQHFEAAFDAGG